MRSLSLPVVVLVVLHVLAVLPSSFGQHIYDPTSDSFSPRSSSPLANPVNLSLSRPEGPRWFWLYLPSNASGPIPLVYYFHGLGGSAQDGLSASQTACDQAGYALISGEGAISPGFGIRAWNGGTCCTATDDVAFALQALQATQSYVATLGLSIAKDRVFSMGFSNGGMMSERLGCERPDVFRAIATISGGMVVSPGNAAGIAACTANYTNATSGGQQTHSFSALIAHGKLDSVIPWNGSGPVSPPFVVIPSVVDDVVGWRTRVGCSNQSQQTLNISSFTNEVWNSCGFKGSEVEFVTVANGQHAWFTVPGQFSASNYSLSFFTRTSVGQRQGEVGLNDSSTSSTPMHNAIVVVAVIVAIFVTIGALWWWSTLIWKNKGWKTTIVSMKQVLLNA